MKFFVILLACIAVLCVQPAEGTMYSPVADGYSYTPDGGVTWYTPILDETLYVRYDSLTYESVLEFNIDPSAHSGDTIVKATLWLYKASLLDQNIGLYGYGADRNGTLDVSDFSASGTFKIGEFSPVDVNEIDVTSYITSLFDKGYQYAGFQLWELIWGEESAFYSSRYNNTPGAPVLEIEYAAVPEPTTLLLLGFGVAGLAALRKKS